MQAFVETIKAWQLHPVVDHFTVALIIVSILVDLVASLFPTRTWMRLMALTLMILGTAAAWGSNVTGGWEAGRVWDNVNGPALIVLKRHAWLGDWLPWVFLVLAVWRLGVQFTLFLDRARPIYMLVALIAGGFIIYQGSLGGRLVYEYGVGTALMPQAATTESPEASPTATPAEPSPIPTVFNPNATPTPDVTASPEASPTATPAEPSPIPTVFNPNATPTPDVTASPEASPAPSESPTPEASPSAAESPSASEATPESSPSEEASPGATPAPKNL